MDQNSNLFEQLALFAASMIAVILRLLQQAEHSIIGAIIEVVVGITFAFVIAPWISESYDLSTRSACFIAWAGTYFNHRLFKGADGIIQSYINKAKKCSE